MFLPFFSYLYHCRVDVFILATSNDSISAMLQGDRKVLSDFPLQHLSSSVSLAVCEPFRILYFSWVYAPRGRVGLLEVISVVRLLNSWSLRIWHSQKVPHQWVVPACKVHSIIDKLGKCGQAHSEEKWGEEKNTNKILNIWRSFYTAGYFVQVIPRGRNSAHTKDSHRQGRLHHVTLIGLWDVWRFLRRPTNDKLRSWRNFQIIGIIHRRHFKHDIPPCALWLVKTYIPPCNSIN